MSRAYAVYVPVIVLNRVGEDQVPAFGQRKLNHKSSASRHTLSDAPWYDRADQVDHIHEPDGVSAEQLIGRAIPQHFIHEPCRSCLQIRTSC